MPKKYKATFTVDRAKWVSGGDEHAVGKGKSALVNKNGFRCCLGFVANQCGVRLKDMLNVPMPYFINKPTTRMLEVFPEGNYALQDKAAEINDSRSPVKTRERKLVKLFARYGYLLNFKGKCVKA
jgi:hypothetical protein